jgi:hypothetical protein
MSRSLDPNATIENYRYEDGTLLIRVRLELQSTIYATESRASEGNGSREVAVQRWRFLDPGVHTLRFDSVANNSVSATIYTQRGITDYQRAIEIQTGSGSGGGGVGPFRTPDLVAVVITSAACFTVALIWQVLVARLGLGKGGERVA